MSVGRYLILISLEAVKNLMMLWRYLTQWFCATLNYLNTVDQCFSQLELLDCIMALTNLIMSFIFCSGGGTPGSPSESSSSASTHPLSTTSSSVQLILLLSLLLQLGLFRTSLSSAQHSPAPLTLLTPPKSLKVSSIRQYGSNQAWKQK